MIKSISTSRINNTNREINKFHHVKTDHNEDSSVINNRNKIKLEDYSKINI